MSPTYTGATPSNINLDPRIVSFFEKFYATSDNPSEQAHEDYVQALTDDGTLIMGSRSATGKEELMTLRKGLWSGPVKTRHHTLSKIFPFGADDSKEVMFYGSVDYGLKNGKNLTVDWAGRAIFVEDSGKLRMKFYQVYLDSAPVANAMKD